MTATKKRTYTVTWDSDSPPRVFKGFNRSVKNAPIIVITVCEGDYEHFGLDSIEALQEFNRFQEYHADLTGERYEVIGLYERKCGS